MAETLAARPRLRSKQRALTIVAGQLTVAVAISAGCALFIDLESGFSALLGGSISAIASFYFVRVAFGRRASSDAKLAQQAMYLGEVVKIFVTVALFSLALYWLELKLLPLILTYAATLLVYWFALLMDLKRSLRKG